MLPARNRTPRAAFVFFDMGGTIMDLSCCYRGILEEWARLRNEGHASAAQLTRRWAALSQEYIAKGVPRQSILDATAVAMEATMAQFSIPGGREQALRFVQAAWKAVREEAKPFPDAVPGVFEDLHGQGFGLGIISDGDREVTDTLIARVPHLELFSSIVTSWEVGVTKPNPLIFQEAQGKTGCDAKRSFFVGDAPADVLGATMTGLQAVLVDRLGEYQGRPIPDLIVRALTDLPGALRDRTRAEFPKEGEASSP